jgi:broad specificity phosphatase PhoE
MPQNLYMTTTLYLVRHGNVHNPSGVFYGRMPGFPLSELGRREAHKLGKFLSAKKLSAIYASPLDRTRETAAIIASYHNKIPITHDPRLVETWSTTQGKLISDLVKFDVWEWYKPSILKLGGEHMSDIWRRMKSFFDDMRIRHKGQEFVAVSHGDPIMISLLKHQGKRLHIHAFRWEDYVPTARGFQLTFEDNKLPRIESLQF